MAAKLGSFRYSFAEKRERDRLLSYKGGGFSAIGLGFIADEGDVEEKRSSTWCCGCCSCGSIWGKVAASWRRLREVGAEAWEMGRADPRKVVFAAKMGLALMLISLMIFLKEPLKDLSRYSVWAILTVVVVFEFSIGATLSKGFNRGLGTLIAGGLALGMAELSELAGDSEEVVIVISIFIIGFIATYAKLHPTLKPYEYGFRVFLLTYCFVMVSGYRTRDFVHTAVTRFVLIALGAGVCLVVNIGIYPIWAGEDLHNLVAKNFTGLATSLEGCVNGYLNCYEYERIPSKILTYQASDDPVYSGYRKAVESTSQEEALVSFAIWEPPHGPYRMLKYPWKNYVKVSGALRHCAFTVMAMHGCILAEIQAPAERRQVFRNELQRVGHACAKVLSELGIKVKKMEKVGAVDILREVHEAAEELQNKVDKKSYLLVNSESWEFGNRSDELGVPQDHLSMDDDENRFREYMSLPVSRSWNFQNANNTGVNSVTSQGIPSIETLERQISCPARNPFAADSVPQEESKTYQSASALSLATFTSLLIECVARLQNLVDSFEELSEKAKFKEPVDPSRAEEAVGLWTKLSRCFKFRKKDAPLLG